MAIDAIGGVSSASEGWQRLSSVAAEREAAAAVATQQAEGVNQADPSAKDASASGKDGSEGKNRGGMTTTVTTHCDKKHEHTPACPHTVTTVPTSSMGRPGSKLDRLV